MKTSKIVFLFVALNIFITSCNEENDTTFECPEFFDLGSFFLNEESFSFIPDIYNESMQRIIFSDSLDNEIIGTVRSFSTFMAETKSFTNYPCEEDPDQSYQYIMERETEYLEFDLEQLDIRISISLSTSALPKRLIESVSTSELHDVYRSDIFLIVLFDPIEANTADTQYSLVVDKRTNPNAENELPSIPIFELHGTEYLDVYQMPITNSSNNYLLYYNTTQGLVGIKNIDNSISLKFKKIE